MLNNPGISQRIGKVMSETKYIGVDAKFADEYEALTSKEAKLRAFDEYLETVKTSSRNEFKASFEKLEEDVAIYKGLMLHVKQAFEKAKNEQFSASYELWEKFEDEIPSITMKTQKIVDILTPLSEKLEKIEKSLSTIRTYEFKELIETVEKFSGLYGKNKSMMDFLVKNFVPSTEKS